MNHSQVQPPRRNSGIASADGRHVLGGFRCNLWSGSRRRSAGFTIVELMFTVTIVGILAAVGLRNYSLAVDSVRIDNYRKSMQRVISQARMEALASGERVAIIIQGQYMIAATGVDQNGDNRLEWLDSNANQLPDPVPSTGTREGELMRVLDFTWVQENFISLIADSSTVGAYQTGCLLATAGACTNVNEIVFDSDGFVYDSMIINPAGGVNALAQFTLAIRDSVSRNVDKQEYALIFIGPGGLIDGYSPQ